MAGNAEFNHAVPSVRVVIVADSIRIRPNILASDWISRVRNEVLDNAVGFFVFNNDQS